VGEADARATVKPPFFFDPNSYHVLLRTTHHSASGLAKEVHSTDDLRSNEFFFELSAGDRRHGDKKGLADDGGQPVNRVH
jgi:hypothetical protein